LTNFGPPIAVVYILSDCGSIAGGWLSSSMISRGFTVNRARKTAMLISAVLVLPIIGAVSIDSLWGAVFVVGLATAGHQSFSCNLYTLPSDLFPRRAVGTVVGIGGTAGAVGGMLMAKFTGWILERTGSYTPIFMIAAFTYLIALAVVQVLAPRYAVASLTAKSA